MSLHPDQIDTFDRNPREGVNPRYAELKQSIGAQGILSQLTVTRRERGGRYMVYGGGNTRLEIAKEIVRENPSHPFLSRLNVTFRAWKGEADCLIAHYAENDIRGDNTFWEKAKMLGTLKAELEKENGVVEYSFQELSKVVSGKVRVTPPTVSLYLFSVDRLKPVGPWLRHKSAERIKLRFDALSRLFSRFDPVNWKERVGSVLAAVIDDHSAHLASRLDSNPIVEQDGVEVDAGEICGALDSRVAQALGVNPSSIAGLLNHLRGHALATSSQLMDIAPSLAEESVAASGKGLDDRARQQPLPMAMLLGVESSAATASSDTQSGKVTSSSTDLIGKRQEVEAPASSDSVRKQGQKAAAQSLFDAAFSLARKTFNEDLFVMAPRMPLGYLMDLPGSHLQASQQLALPEDKQLILRKGGWQLLAILSGQFDARLQVPRALPSDTRWSKVIEDRCLETALDRCGCSLESQRKQLQIDGAGLYCILTEPKVFGPAVGKLLETLRARQLEMSRTPGNSTQMPQSLKVFD